MMFAVPIVVVAAFAVIAATIKILRQYERAVVFTLGRFQGVKGPGLVLLIRFFQEMVRVDLRIQVIEIPTQDVISRDNVSMKVDAVLYFNVVDPERAFISVQRYLPATVMLAQTTLRAVLGQHELDEMLSERKKLSADVQSILDAQTETWGIKVTNVEIRTVELTENMVRAIAKQAEAERDRRAKVIHAEAEFQASQTLVNAAQILSSIPAAMQLRYLQTLTEIGAEQNSTVVFPMPIDVITPFLQLLEKAGKPASANGAARPTHKGYPAALERVGAGISPALGSRCVPVTDAAFVLIQHLDPTRKSMMIGYSRAMAMPAADSMTLERDYVLLHHLEARDGTQGQCRPDYRPVASSWPSPSAQSLLQMPQASRSERPRRAPVGRI
jgi:regulator of protease activity HflC (stomatin/prohibitin superfamily)